jgi:hypothetical protein
MTVWVEWVMVFNATFNHKPNPKKSQYEFNQYLLNFNLKKKRNELYFYFLGEGARVAQ